MLPTKGENGKWTMTNALGAGAGPGGAWAITVNTVGAFYAGQVGNLTLTTDRGRIPGGTPRAQEFILMHEVGHDTNVLRPDKNNQLLVDANDKDLEDHCKKTINSFPK